MYVDDTKFNNVEKLLLCVVNMVLGVTIGSNVNCVDMYISGTELVHADISACAVPVRELEISLYWVESTSIGIVRIIS